MDARQFDFLTKRLTHRRSRRGLLAAGALAMLGLSAGDHAGAKKKKPCPPCKKRKQGKCKGKKPDGTPCENGGSCHGGQCVGDLSPPLPPCAEGQKLCQGTCIPNNQCCSNSDCGDTAPRCCRGTCLRPSECCTSGECTGGKTCQQASCRCPVEKPKDCNGLCLLSSDCCDNRDCAVAGQVCTAARQCICPDAAPVVCGGVCRAVCNTDQFNRRLARDPNTCGCCVRNFQQSFGFASSCCSGRDASTVFGNLCVGRDTGESCSFSEQCFSEQCFFSSCSCVATGGSCQKPTHCCTGTCDGGRCVQ